MQERHVESLIQTIEEKVPGAKEQIRREFEAVIAEGKLLSLTEEEVRLVESFRQWKRTSDAAGGVFHWKRRA